MCLVENVAYNIQEKKQFAKFRVLQIEEGKYVYHIYNFVTLTFRTKVILLCRLGIMIIHSWSRARHCWRDFVSSVSDFE